MDPASPKRILIGRTGTGKTAVIERLKSQKGDQVVLVDPMDLSITHLTSTDVVPRLHAAGVNMDPLYRWLWRHVILVSVIKKWNETRPPEARRELKQALIDLFRREKAKQREVDKGERAELVDYTEEWGERFFEIEQLDIREVVSKINENISDQSSTSMGVSGSVGGGGFQAGGQEGQTHSVSEESQARETYRQAAQRIVSQSQATPLRKATSLVERHILTNPQRPYFVVIDDLDHGWVDAEYAYDLIIALLMEVQELSRLSGLKIVISLRQDVIEKIQRSDRQKPGLQWEKVKSHFVRLDWTENELYDLIDLRLAEMARNRQGRRPSMENALPERHRGLGGPYLGRRHLFMRTMGRPREMIDFMNECIAACSSSGQISWKSIHDAEVIYSTERVTSLENEWGQVFPGVSMLLEPLRGWTDGGTLIAFKGAMSRTLSSTHLDEGHVSYRIVEMMTAGGSAEDAAIQTAVKILYRVGALGLKGATDEIRFSYTPRGRAEPTLSPDTRLYVHPGFYLALDVVSPHYSHS